ncbi:N-6 DNA methylase [Acidithiobacillus ferriphilus]|uniref:N-6 DNA methylase n=1 Tax=Acidithiobacillus ferriphilus TaxID=1689834 RepID=UPI0023306782|nr:N-6 DNA methylase [Acidithiobacillus ferriphilus]WCE95267.1 N-6 DNA methylase [Acidithiobacillus ferriphilus]
MTTERNRRKPHAARTSQESQERRHNQSLESKLWATADKLFIDARNLGSMADRTHRELSDEDIQKIADTYHHWRGDGDGEYEDVPGFCKAASLDDIRKNGHVLTPGRYVGAAAKDDDDEPFEEKMARLTKDLSEQLAEGRRLEEEMRKNFRVLGYEL